MVDSLKSTPRADGFRMPGEFEPHRGCWMLWPERPDNWRLGAKPAQQAFAALAAAIAPSEPVTVGVSASQFGHARAVLPPAVRVVELSSNDAWMRDVGPTFVRSESGALRAIDWRFNAWGGLHNGLYFPWDLDDAVARKIAEIELAPCYRAPLVMEGGAIHVDGEGTLITTEECLLSPGRNPQLSRGQIERLLADYLAIDRVIWLPEGLHNDETDGHVDNLLHFIAPGQVVLNWCDDPGDPQYRRSRQAMEVLEWTPDARGRRLTVHRLPQPGPLFLSADEAAGLDPVASGMAREAGERLAASYCNFYIGNRRVIFPLLDPRHDAAVQAQLAALFPGRDVVGVPGREILLGGGNIHCVTQQVPL